MNKFIFAYSCLTNFLSVAEGIKNPNKKNLAFILIANFVVTFVVVMAIGTMSYLQIESNKEENLPDLIINWKNLDKDSKDLILKFAKNCLFISLSISTAINIAPLKEQLKVTLKMADTMVSNFIISLGLLTIMCLFAYFIPTIDIIINIASGLFGVPMIYLFPSLACIKMGMHKTSVGALFLKIWTGFWSIYVLVTIYYLIGDIQKALK